MKPKIVKKDDPKPKKDKSQSKRLKTFSSSEFSLWEEKSKAMMASATDLTNIKNEAALRRAYNNSALSQYASSKGNTSKLPVKKKKKVGPKTRTKVKKLEQQQFQKAKYKQSNSQSEIIFSNDETKRQSAISIKDVKHVHSIHAYQQDSNLVLRVSIKKEYIRKVEAATKIQKVFRGFMTRKILMRYVNAEEERLRDRLVANSSSEFDEARQNQTHRTFVDRDGENLMSRLFENRAIGDLNFNHEIRPRAEQFSQPSQQSDNEQSPQKQQPPGSQRQKKPQTWMQSQNPPQQSHSDEQQQNSSQGQDSNMVYRRQNPIYSQQQISQYLESSEQDEEYQQQLDGYEPEIIFQTNEEYIESRKSSLQNKNETVNKLSNKGITDIAALLGGDDKIRKELRGHDEGKGPQSGKNSLSERSERSKKDNKEVEKVSEKKVEALDEKVENKKFRNQEQQPQPNRLVLNGQPPLYKTSKPKQDEQPQQKLSLNLPKKIEQQQHQQPSPKSQQKPAKSPRRQIKYLDEQQDELSNNSASHKSHISAVQQKQIIRLREQECEKWQEVIRMVSQQIRKNSENNGEMVNFMKNIMEFSQKNKELLGSTRSVNSQSDAFTTPTSMDVYHSVKVKESSNSVGLPVRGEIDEGDRNQDGGKFFKKKKPLKIDIIDSNFLRDQRQSMGVDKSQTKVQKISQFSFENELQLLQNRRKKQQKQEQQPTHNKFQRSHNKPSTEPPRNKPQYQQSLQKSRTLKKYLATNIQVQDEAVYDILKLREELLQKRESEQLMKLNNELNRNQLTQEKFLEKLANMTKKFMEEKHTIDKAKEDIIKGYQAANNLVKEYFFDVRRMGIKLAVSKSQDNLKYKFSQPLHFASDIKIDELTPKSTPKSGKRVPMKQIFAEHEIAQESSKQKSANVGHHSNFQSSQDSSVDFTEEELKRFRKAANYDLQFNDLNRNMTTISDQFIKQQRKCFQDEFDSGVNAFYDSPENTKGSKAIAPQRQTYLLDQLKAPSSRTPPHIEAIVDSQVNRLMWQLACQLLLRPQISDKFMDRPSIIRPTCITNEQRVAFLQILQQNLPEKHVMHQKLNQNITPLPSQILKCMRLDFSEDGEEEDQDDNYEEINRYEFVISQEACAKSVMLFKNDIDQQEQRKEIEQIKKCNEIHRQLSDSLGNTWLGDKIERYLSQRQKFIKNKKQHTRELRWQVMNIELHCIFDSWNEEIIQICSVRCGFSGIGLNELTLSMINHNKPVPQHKSETVVMDAKEKVLEILDDDTDINAKVLRENFHQMCQNDSAWIFYADQALSYALELVYLVEQDIYSQITKQLRKIMVKNSLSLP